MSKQEKDHSRQLVVTLKNNGISSKNISQEQSEIGKKYSERQINQICADFKKRGTSETLLNNCGRPSSISENQKQIVLEFFRENPKASLMQFCNDEENNIEGISIQSVSNILHSEGFSSFKLPNIIQISEQNIKKRYNFAIKHQLWQGKWKQVLFSDEIMFEVETADSKYEWTQDNLKFPQIYSQKETDSQ